MVDIWVDHLEDLARAARIYERFVKDINAGMPGNYSDLEFQVGPVPITIDGMPTGWSLTLSDGAPWLRLDDEDVDSITPVG